VARLLPAVKNGWQNLSSTHRRRRRFKRAMADNLRVNLGPRSYSIVFGADVSADLRGVVDELAERSSVRPCSTTPISSAHSPTSCARSLPACRCSRSSRARGRSRSRVSGACSIFWRRRSSTAAACSLRLGRRHRATWLGLPRRAGCVGSLLPGADDAAGDGGQLRWRQDRDQPRGGQEPRGRVSQREGRLHLNAAAHNLPAREFAAGAAEVIKYGLLADADLYGRLEAAPWRWRAPRSPDHSPVLRDQGADRRGR